MCDFPFFASAIYVLAFLSISGYFSFTNWQLGDYVKKIIIRKQLYFTLIFPFISVLCSFYLLYVIFSVITFQDITSESLPFLKLEKIVFSIVLAGLALFYSVISFFTLYSDIFIIGKGEISGGEYLIAKEMMIPSNEHYFSLPKLTYSDFYNIEYIYENNVKKTWVEQKLHDIKMAELRLEDVKKNVLK